MDAHRLNYLQALNIDVWERRSLAEETMSAVAAVEAPNRYLVGVQHAEPIRHAERSSLATESPQIPVATLDWAALEAAVKNCTACELHRGRKQAVFGIGDRQATWMIIGDAPGFDGDAQGEPFAGHAGQLFNAMLKAMGMQRNDVFITNVLKSPLPNNRDPKPAEVTACMPFLQRQIELVNPKVIIGVGRIAAQQLLSTTDPIGKLRGQVHRLGKRPVIVMEHPSHVLRNLGEKRRVWQDLVLAMNTMQELTTSS